MSDIVDFRCEDHNIWCCVYCDESDQTAIVKRGQAYSADGVVCDLVVVGDGFVHGTEYALRPARCEQR